ncbi:Sister chromatid cohesion protein DCC1 [Toxocara canis]|uniref:Sister chromatid cohesion protein DCC1 n=1 Tax=Toxocara canis TaxID=6265 RepID=A0A0B2V3D5_TOXCA|nr:Sister chromatid cohesion protein DCC1 [Toxocara canis]
MEKFLEKKLVPSTSNGNMMITHQNVDSTFVIQNVHAKRGQLQDPGLSAAATRRNIDNLNALFDVAKLSNLKGEVQQIELSSTLLSGDYRLMEVNAELAEQIESGVRLVFRGELDDFPVLCNKEKTYRVKEAETSNTLLVMPDLHFTNETGIAERFLTSRMVVAIQSRYLELREADVISLNRLKELLRETELQWDDGEDIEQDCKPFTFEDLLDVVQMSEMQLKDALERLPVIHYNGFLRMLSSTYRDRLLMELTDCCDDDDEPQIQVDSFSVEAFYETLKRRNQMKAIPKEAVLWLIKSHCHRISNDGDGGEVFALDERAVCRSKISQLLRAAVRFEYSAFNKLIRQMLPEGMEMKDEYLNGLALVEESLAKGKTIRYMNIEDMPEEESKRLELLFSIRPKWKLADIQHFFTDLCPTSRSLSEMLAKHCRQSTIGGEQYLVSLK